MKKLAILVGAIALTTTSFGQKATLDNPFSLEGAMSCNLHRISSEADPFVYSSVCVTMEPCIDEFE